MRIWVIIDIRNHLKTGFQLRRNGLPDILVDFKYERLSQFSYSCGRIGHVFRTCKFSTTNAKFGPSMRAMPSDAALSGGHCSGAEPRVFNRSSREVCTSLVALPPPKAIIKQSMSEIWPRPGMQSGSGQSCAAGVTRRYLWQKLIIDIIDSIAMVMNSAIICSHVSHASAYEGKWRLLVVVAGHIFYLVLKLTRIV